MMRIINIFMEKKKDELYFYYVICFFRRDYCWLCPLRRRRLEETKMVDNNYESDDKMVSHPNHYQTNSGLEVIDIIEAVTADLKGIEATDTGNIIKYACRWKKKDGIRDLEKIMWYAKHLINHLKKEEVKDDV